MVDVQNGWAPESLARVVADCIGDGVYVLDAQGKLVYMNPAAEGMLGWKTADLRGKPMHDAVHYLTADGSRRQAAECRLLTVLTTGVVVRDDDDVFVRADGSFLPVAYTSAPLMVEGRIEGAVLVFRDITAEKEARQERERLLADAQAAHERYRDLIEAMPVHVWTAAPNGSLTFVSTRMTDFAGKAPSAILAAGLTEIVHPADAAAVQNAWQQSVSTGIPLNIEARILRGRDFKYLWHVMRAVPCKDRDGKVREWIGTNSDIDGEKRATEVRDAALALARVERERLMRVFTHAPAVMALYRGPEHVITLVNPMWERFVGKGDVVGKTLREAFPELEGQGIFELVDRVFETGELYQVKEMPVRFDRHDSGKLEQTWWSFVLQQLPGDTPANTDVLAFAVEVTDQVQARESMEQAS